MNFKEDLELVVNEISKIILEKNRKYGDSALRPVGVFSKLDAIEGINIRIDDKLKRIQNQQVDEDEDAELDLIGYLILKRIYKTRKARRDDGVYT